MRTLLIISFLFISLLSVAGNCDYPNQLDSAGRRCGGRAASVIPGGRLGGDGRYKDSYGRDRIYGQGNDVYDKNFTPAYGNQQKPAFSNQYGF